jgi:hypothetical protein
VSNNDIELSETLGIGKIVMSEQDKTLMAEYGVTSSTKTVYFYKEYRYDRLSDVLSYDKSDTKRAKAGGEPSTPA